MAYRRGDRIVNDTPPWDSLYVIPLDLTEGSAMLGDLMYGVGKELKHSRLNGNLYGRGIWWLSDAELADGETKVGGNKDR